MKKLFIALIGLLFLGLSIDCYANTYTIRIYGGKWGKVNGKEMVQKEVEPGTYFRFQDLKTESTNKKYYIKGIRLSGRDNNTVGLSGFTVEQDEDYVLAFGIKGDMVPYLVRYVDEKGKELKPEETYYGNIGDRPVAAYIYIEGYRPNAKNITGTLKEKDNVFTFVYSKENTPSTTKTQKQIQEEQVASSTQKQKATQTTPSQATTQQENVQNENNNQQPPSTSSRPAPERSTEEPPEIIDIDNPDVPLTNYDNDEPTKEEDKKEESPYSHFLSKTGIFLIFSILFPCLIILFILILWWKRKKKEEKTVEKVEKEEKISHKRGKAK